MSRSKGVLSLAAVVCAVLMAPPARGQTTWYVDDDASLGGDGQTWNTAHKHLQDALAAAIAGDEIRVAGGTYNPDQDEAGNVTEGDRGAAFRLATGVGLYGGHQGCPDGSCDGGDPNERDIEIYETVLSGDLAANDVVVASPEDLPNEPTRAENSFHVVISLGVLETAVLDGFTVTDGNANAPDPGNAGGGMYNLWGIPTLRNCTFSANSAEYGGGMFNIENSEPTLTDCTFRGNSAEYGGGMSNEWHSHPRLTDCTFSGNSATYGGGIRNDDSSPTLTVCTFSGNSAWLGGGMLNDASWPTLTGCTFSDNSAEGGGGMHNRYRSWPTLTDCAFSGNSASGGGGMYNDECPEPCYTTLTSCVFSENSANSGGGVFNTNAYVTLTSCAFSGNSAGKGGGMYNNSSSPTLTNCTFLGNSAVDLGGGIDNITTSSPTLTNCTFSENSAGNHGGGASNAFLSSPTLTNCILWGNEPEELYSGDSWSTPTVSFSDIEGGLPAYAIDGGDNIDLPPLFVPGPAGCRYLSQTAAGQAEESPCVDAGSDTAAILGLDALTTRSDEIADVGRVDMGYHYPVTGEPLNMGDYDRNGVLDLIDFSHLQMCFTGSGPTYVSPCCRIFDFAVSDGDVDENDHAAFCVGLTGP